jgi:helicase required for RNAi-mediated heterochromatin assembly 1
MTNILTAMCCDPCKCQTCSDRTNGSISMLRPVNNGVSGFRSTPTSTGNLLHGTRVPQRSSPARSSRTEHSFDRGSEQLEAFSVDSFQAEDFRVQQQGPAREAERREHDRSSTPATGPCRSTMKLIEISPEKAAASRNTNLLVDLNVDVSSQPQRRRRGPETSSYAAAAGGSKAKDGSNLNLLD